MGIIFGQRAHPLDQLWIDSPRTENILKSLLSGLSYFPALAKNVMAGSESHPIFSAASLLRFLLYHPIRVELLGHEPQRLRILHPGAHKKILLR